MRSEAKIGPIPMAVEGERLGALLDDVPDDLDLELFALRRKELLRFLRRDLLADEGEILGDLRVGLGFDLLEVLGGKRGRSIEDVIEAVFDGWPDGDLGAGKQALNGAGHHVRGIMACYFQPFRRLVGEGLTGGVGSERAAEVHVLSVQLGEDRGSRQSRADLLLHEVGDGGPFFNLLLASVWKGDGDLLAHRSVGPSGFEPLTPTVSR